jgi:hypothetical protein
MRGLDTVPDASALVTAGFVVLPMLVAAAFVLGVAIGGRRMGNPSSRRRWLARTAAAAAVWMLLCWAVAATGALRAFDAVPPPLAVLLAVIAALGIAIAASPIGGRLARLPLAALVGVQVFRFPLELLMHQAHVEGVMPIQMSYSGRNLDILTGISAGLLAIALARWRVPRWVVGLWNVAGLALLANVVAVAVVSNPPFRWFGDDSLALWVTYPPFVWLPAVLVLAAWAGHLVIFRALVRRPASS